MYVDSYLKKRLSLLCKMVNCIKTIRKGENENAIVLLKEHVRLTPQDYK